MSLKVILILFGFLFLFILFGINKEVKIMNTEKNNNGFLKFLFILFGLLSISLIASGFYIDSHNTKPKTTTITKEIPPRATVTKYYQKNQILKYKQVNSTQYSVTLKNGKKMVANLAHGNPPTKKTMNLDRPLLIVSTYWTSYKRNPGIIKSKENTNVQIYFNEFG